MNRIKMRTQDAKKRIMNFDEVELGYNSKEAIKEASRCLNCQNPMCVKGCPVNIAIPKFIKAIKEENLDLAASIIHESSYLPAICGRVCPQERQCEKLCIRGLKGESIAIGSLERYVADYYLKQEPNSLSKKKENGKKVAIIGSGPSGLTCAGELITSGFKVDVYESLHKAGGVLTYGIPEFRLPKSIVEQEIKKLEELGVNFILNAPVGKIITLDELTKKYDAIYIATGAGLPKFAGINNETANGVFSANEILTRINLMKSYEKKSKTPIKNFKKVIVVGGGNVAIDVARSLKRLGSDVTIIYRRSMEEIPARKIEVEHAIEEQIKFELLTNPVSINVDEENNVTSIEVVKMALGDTLESGRRSVKEIANSNYLISCDMVVMALGTNPNSLILSGSNIKTNEGLIVTNDTKTNIDNVFAGGDAVTGSATVILAMEAGKKASERIKDFLK